MKIIYFLTSLLFSLAAYPIDHFLEESDQAKHIGNELNDSLSNTQPPPSLSSKKIQKNPQQSSKKGLKFKPESKLDDQDHSNKLPAAPVIKQSNITTSDTTSLPAPVITPNNLTTSSTTKLNRTN
jgi:hypothetical protein